MADETKPILETGELTHRQRQLAVGVSLLEDGVPEREAAAAVGLAKTTLRDAYQRLRSGLPDRESALKEADNRILDHSIVIAEAAASQLAESIYRGEITDHKQLAIVGGIYLDKVSKIRGYDRNQAVAGGAFEQVLERLSDLNLQAQITVSPADPASKAVDVTPRDGADEG